MREYDDPWWESCDAEGNPEVDAGSPKEEPDCPPCGDTGRVTRFGRSRRCPSCDPTRLDALLHAVRWRRRRLTGRLRQLTAGNRRRGTSTFDDQAPF